MDSISQRTVTDSEYTEYVNWVAAEWGRYRTSVRTEPLWHYTTGQGAIDIITSGTVWATQMGCLNDTTELTHAPGVLRLAVDNMSRHAASEVERTFFTRWLEIMRQPVGFAAHSPFYVACLSEDGDDLSQWRAYGGGEGGIALGFWPQKLDAKPAEEPRVLIPVQYRQQVQLATAQRVCDATYEFHSRHGALRAEGDRAAWEQDFISKWDTQLSYLSPMHKNPAFATEREWRIIKEVLSEHMPALKFRQRQSMISSHIPLSFFDPFTLQPAPLLPLCAVRVGPSRHKPESRASIVRLLAARGYDLSQIQIESSPIPFQAH